MCSERIEGDDETDRPVSTLPPDMLVALDKFIREHRRVLEALARL
ncbi:MAG: hypothetical protein QMD46_06700 [Methanomicrobiales archaeon]|nr:hypothetical protein [Methanomicrobiales archaeon]